MHPSIPRRAALAGLLALGLAGLAVQPAAAEGAPAPTPSRGVGMAAPVETADSLRSGPPEGQSVAPPPAPAVPDRRVVPLLLDTSDYGFGASVIFGRLPDLRDINDLGMISAVQHVIVSLPAWPSGYDVLEPLGQALLPEGADLIVILPGYPPTRAAAEAWNYLRIPLRLVLVVDGPPGSRVAIDELNRIRGLERVIAEMEHPSRSGFERLQRPLSFRVLMR